MRKPPQHIAIVMDGNGRWAKRRMLPRAAGHRAGATAVQKSVEFCVKKNIKALTLFALSIENRAHRPLSEVQFLMSLFLESLERNTQKLHDNNVQIRVIGNYHQFDGKLLAQIRRSQELTAHNTGLVLTVAINYSGRWDITQAVRKVAIAAVECLVMPDNIDEAFFSQYLCLQDLPNPDLLIRTSGEQRISNFMLWQFAYTEMFFSEMYWPDFNEGEFEKALEFYYSRERRFGKTGEQVQAGA